MITRFLKDEKQRRIAAFVLKAIGMYVLWFLVYDFWLAPEGKLDAWLNKRAANDGSLLLQLIGYNSSTSPGIASATATGPVRMCAPSRGVTASWIA